MTAPLQEQPEISLLFFFLRTRAENKVIKHLLSVPVLKA